MLLLVLRGVFTMLQSAVGTASCLPLGLPCGWIVNSKCAGFFFSFFGVYFCSIFVFDFLLQGKLIILAFPPSGEVRQV